MSQKYLGGYLADTTSFTVAGSTDAQFNYVTALLHGDGTNAAQNNTFIDSSTNALSITRNGNTAQGTFSPYGTLWSNYFAGATNYFSVANNTALQMSTGDFTIEFWINFSSLTGYQTIFDKGYVGAGGLTIQTNTGTGTLIVYASGSGVITASSASTVGEWDHYALVRNGTTLTLYKNGTSVGSASNSTNFNDTSSLFIFGSPNSGGYYANGYLSNLRIVKGTAVYTTTFTPPTTPLTAVSGTSLITCQNNRFIDNSTNAFAITVTGTPSVQRFSPFVATAAYSTSTIGGSGYFDGTGDYLLTASNAAFTLAGNFTIEGWMYMTAGANDISLFTLGDASAATGIQVYYYNSAIRMYSGATIISSSTVPNFNAWIHVAVVRSGTTVTLYLNGVSNGTATKSTTYSGAFYTGAASVGPGEYMNGSISDIRVVNGTAVYTTTFTPPTAPLTAITNTSYLLSFTNGAIYDNAMMNDYETVGSAQISTGIYKYGTGSMSFNGSASYLQAPANAIYGFSTGSFTVEFWVYVTSYTTTATTVARTAGTSGWVCQFNGSNQMVFYANGSAQLTDTASPSTSTWTHFAVVRNGSALALYRNGTSVATATYATAINPTGVLLVGCGGDANNTLYCLNGYIDDFRITRGYARYTANFTPPTAAFGNSGTGITYSIVPTATAAPGIWTMEQQGYYKAQSLWPVPPVLVSYLVVAGGGGGAGGFAGDGSSGGGGAGGLLSGSSMSLVKGTSYTATVGAGGNGGAAGRNNGVLGNDSVFNGITSTGGGRGAYQSGAAGGAGGSGGGGAGGGSPAAGAGGAGTSGQGSNGGAGGGASSYLGGGGGGASAVGGSASGGSNGAGGAGTASSITGSSVTYAGGGGAGCNYYTPTAQTPGAGGAGGGGGGGAGASNGTAGTANRGGGGGAGAADTGNGAGGAGGSGVVIISSAVAAASTTGSPTVTTSGGNTIYTFTSSGTITF